MTKPVVTRFAPSPTGFLHIGGGRTALFNWLYAKHTGGKMLLRIEDTDRERSTDAAIAAILDGLKWLELNWDGEPIYQFSRADRHREVAEALVAAGKAYQAYETAEELNDMRAKARAEGKSPRYSGRWRDADPSEAPAGAPSVVRIKSPIEGETVIEDRVQGRVAFPNADLDDFIILRSDGTPTYMHAVVVDDHDMGVTHIIRGDDHLTNAGRQKILFDALGWDLPVMAHIPLIHGSDGAKLSKRHGALGVDAYRAMGYLPEAMRNYLVRLGWSHGDDEIMSTEQMIEWFDIDAINRGAARFDFAKLESVNARYLRLRSDEDLVNLLVGELPHLAGGEAFEVRLDGLSSFGGHRPRAIVATAAPSQPLLELQSEHERLLRRIGLEPEGRKYTPHVTLAWLRDSSSHQVADYLSTRGHFRSPPFEVPRFVLFSSRDSVGGGPYVVEADYPLADSAPQALRARR